MSVPSALPPQSHPYLEYLRQHVVAPMLRTELSDHCFAVAILTFAAMEGLGGLVANVSDKRDRRDVNYAHFCAFLQRMKGSYSSKAKSLWRLRTALTHSALNADTDLSHLDGMRDFHLTESHGHLFVHTGCLTEDFAIALDALDEELKANVPLRTRFESRIQINATEDDRVSTPTCTPAADMAYLAGKDFKPSRVIP